MAWSEAGLNAAADGIAGAGGWISAHTGDPGATGVDEVTGGGYARQQTTWGSAEAGDRTGSQVTVGIPAGTTVTHWAVWSAASGGTFLGGFALDSPEVFGSTGTLAVTPTIDVDPA